MERETTCEKMAERSSVLKRAEGMDVVNGGQEYPIRNTENGAKKGQ
jgi:hypothetical protein